MIKRTLLLAATAGLVGCGASDNDDRQTRQTGSPTTVPAVYEDSDPQMQQGWIPGATTQERTSEQFAREAAMGDMMEIELGQVALERADSDAVRAFAERMIQDHTRMSGELATVARSQNIGMPMGMTGLHQDAMTRLSQLEGAAFDRAYMQQMVTDHQRTIGLFERQARDGGNPAMQSVAQQSLPVLRDHLREAQQIVSRMDGVAAPAAGPSIQPGSAPAVRPASTPTPPPAAQPPQEFVSPPPSTSPAGEPR